MSKEAAEQLLEDGYTQDLAKILPKAAPVLYDRYKPLFGKSVAGIPLSISHRTRGRAVALVLQGDIAAGLGAPIRTMSDVLDFVENGSARIVDGASLNSAIMDAWAGEQGYYPLERFDIVGQFYAAYADPDSTPVPVERIPGFDGFFRRSFRDFKDRKLLTSGDYSDSSGEGVAGYVGMLSDPMDTAFLDKQGKTWNGLRRFPVGWVRHAADAR